MKPIATIGRGSVQKEIKTASHRKKNRDAARYRSSEIAEKLCTTQMNEKHFQVADGAALWHRGICQFRGRDFGINPAQEAICGA